jgi:hypothetical protein
MQIVSLGSVTFNDIVEQGLYIDEEYKWLSVGQSIRYALAGNTVMLENPRSGKPLTLIAQEDRGWITKATLLELKTLASLINTTHVLTLVNDSNVTENRNVRFKRDNYPLDLNPLDSAHNYYVGSIYLIQV